MKRILALLLAALMVLGMVACAGTGTKQEGTKQEETKTAEEKKEEQKDLVGDVNVVSEQEVAKTEVAETEDEEASRYGGDLVVRSAGAGFSYPDPLKTTGVWAYQLTTVIWENPLTRDASNKVAPGVCDYELSDDLLTVTMWVRDNQFFSNGDPVDIYDIEASYTRSFNLYGSMKTYVVPFLESMTVDGDKLTIKFTEYSEKELHYIASYQPWTAVMPKEICEKYAEEFIPADQWQDAIGTGPYKLIEFVEKTRYVVDRNEYYVTTETGRTGFAGPKHAYMDTISFMTNADDGGAALAVLAGDYDVVEAIPKEYFGVAEQQHVVATLLPSDTGCEMRFNAKGPGVTARYPSLRKAVMAAIDYEEFLKVVTDDQQVLKGCPVTGDIYYTDKFIKADYWGPTNLEACNKYLEQAKAEGWDGVEPVEMVRNTSRTDIGTMVQGYMDKAGIPFNLTYMESAATSEFVSTTNLAVNKWDIDFTWPTYAATPTTLSAALTTTYWENEEAANLLTEMGKIPNDSEEYMKMWDRYSDIWVDEAAVVFMGYIDWWWWGPETLHYNDEGLVRYWFNAFWEDPENHVR